MHAIQIFQGASKVDVGVCLLFLFFSSSFFGGADARQLKVKRLTGVEGIDEVTCVCVCVLCVA